MEGAALKLTTRKQQSDLLAAAMRRKEPGAFERFVELHADRAESSKGLVLKSFPEANEEDAIQIAMIGVIEAAKTYDERMGRYFSSYANVWIHKACRMFAPEHELLIRLPSETFWNCHKLQYQLECMIAAHGKTEAERLFEKQFLTTKIRTYQWQETVAISELPEEECQFVYEIIDHSQQSPYEIPAYKELRVLAVEEFNKLPKKYGNVLGLRYGFGGKQLTFKQIAKKLKLTRQRVCQIQVEAETILAERVGRR